MVRYSINDPKRVVCGNNYGIIRPFADVFSKKFADINNKHIFIPIFYKPLYNGRLMFSDIGP
jgi:hypothetical protein